MVVVGDGVIDQAQDAIGPFHRVVGNDHKNRGALEGEAIQPVLEEPGSRLQSFQCRGTFLVRPHGTNEYSGVAEIRADFDVRDRHESLHSGIGDIAKNNLAQALADELVHTFRSTGHLRQDPHWTSDAARAGRVLGPPFLAVERLDQVALFEFGEALHADAALLSGVDLADFVAEPTKS